MRIGKVESYLYEASSKRPLLAALIDPFKDNPEINAERARKASLGGADIILIGGSVGAGISLNQTVRLIKEKVNIPVILFPGNVDGVSPYADAVLFMSLINSTNPYWIIKAQALAAPIVWKYKLEAIPTAYMIFEPGGRTSAGWVGDANPIPRDRPEIGLAYALAAQFLGMRWIYLEAGSGAEETIPLKTITIIRKNTNLGIIVGGGIKSGKIAAEKFKAGANIVVVGTAIEEVGDVEEWIREFRSEINSAAKT